MPKAEDGVTMVRLERAYERYKVQVSKVPLGYGSARANVLLPWYHDALYEYLTVHGVLNTAYKYVYHQRRWAAGQPTGKELEAELLKIVPAGKIPHPNEYLSEEQRAVLVLLDKLDKEET